MRKKSGNKKVAVLSAVLIVLLAAVCLGIGMHKSPAQEQPQGTGEDLGAGTASGERNPCLIQTPYIQLHFDEAFADLLAVVRTEGDPYLLEFYALLDEKPEQRLFDIAIGEGADGNLGAIRTDKGVVPVSMTIYSFEPDDSWTKGEIDTVLAMQDVANDLMQQLMAYQAMDGYDGPEITKDQPESTLTRFMTIWTPYTDLLYPLEWANDLQLEEKETAYDYSVLFYGRVEEQDPVLLFTIIFGGDSGEQLGAITFADGSFITVNIVMEELHVSGVSDADMARLYEMQEAVNTMIAEMNLN